MTGILYHDIFLTIGDINEDEHQQLTRASKLSSDYRQWPENLRIEIVRILGRKKHVFDAVHKASLKPHCDFNLDYAANEFENFPVHKFTTLSKLLSARAALDKNKGNVNKAIERITDGFAVAEAAGTSG